jgi:DGQHR domain-containing protein
MSIKAIVFEYIHLNNGIVDFEELSSFVLDYQPKSAWNKTHWSYYRSNIISPNGRYFNQFTESEKNNLKKPVETKKDSPLRIDNRWENNLTSSKKINMSTKIFRSASLVKQGGLTLYATSLKVSDLLIPNFYSIDRLDPENANEKGYQRLLNKGRAKKLADYIVSGQDTKDAFLPTSIFLATHKNIAFSPSNNTIEIDVQQTGPFNVVDGQHRVEGLKMAAEKDDRVLDFEVPVNIAINLSEIEQMCHFLIVNTTQKSVEEGVAQRIRARLTRAMGVDETPNLPKWIFNSVQKGEDEKALQYVDFLNSEKDSPWLNRIKMANDDSGDGTVNQKSFVKAIKKYILVANNPIVNTEKEDRQHRIFLNYWKAITNILGVDEPTVLFKYNGVELFCKFCVPFLNKMVNMPDYKTSTMQALMEQVFENAEGDGAGVGHTDFWVRGGTASGLNTGALSKINAEMVKSLYKPIDLQKEKEMEI